MILKNQFFFCLKMKKMLSAWNRYAEQAGIQAECELVANADAAHWRLSRHWYGWGKGRSAQMECRTWWASVSSNIVKFDFIFGFLNFSFLLPFHNSLATKKVFNKQFGSVFRTYNNPTYFSRRLFRFSDIYTSNISNLVNYSTSHTFYPRRGVMPHEYSSLFL